MSIELPVRIEPEQCSGCGACVTACPVDVLRLDAATGKAAVAYPSDCCTCNLCRDDCPTAAISVNHDAGNPRLVSIYDQLKIELPAWST